MGLRGVFMCLAEANCAVSPVAETTGLLPDGSIS